MAFWVVYSVGCIAVSGRTGTAFDNARLVWSTERAWRMPSEAAIQGALVTHAWLIRSANVYYALVHFLATGIFLVWLYRTRPEHYLWARRVLSLVTASALAIYLLFPLAPPRMRGETGMIDAGAMYGPGVYSNHPQHDHFENQYAAMPSVHVAWATFIAIGIIMATRSRWRWLWLLHAVITALVVVGTGNHYVLVAVVAWILLVGIMLVLRPPVGNGRLKEAPATIRRVIRVRQPSRRPAGPAQ